jgi:4-diphosphocytidyl-2-C-methyl-D-erythritol kinase
VCLGEPGPPGPRVAGPTTPDLAVGVRRNAAWCTGRGEVVSPVPAGPPLHLVIVKPPVGCPTAEVYRRYKPGGTTPDPRRVIDAFTRGDAEELAAGLHNALQPAAFDLQPPVRKVYDRLTHCDPLGVLLSGSGASVFAVARTAADAAAIAERFARLTDSDADLAACRVFAVRTPGAMT